MTAAEASLSLLFLVAGVVALAAAFTAVFDGCLWQASLFALGGVYVVTWAGRRIVPVRTDR